MADGWIVLLAIVGLLTLAVITSIITGAWERVQKYRADKQTEGRLRGP